VATSNELGNSEEKSISYFVAKVAWERRQCQQKSISLDPGADAEVKMEYITG
jgi:hypothetical protein